MSKDTTENDAEIARILSEEYQFGASLYSPNSFQGRESFVPTPKERKEPVALVNNFENDLPITLRKHTTSNNEQIDDDAEMALILQIEEIVLLENHINMKTTKNCTDEELQKSHAELSNALKPESKQDFMARVFGMLVTIQTRYADCRAKNAALIDQIQKISVQLYPLVVGFRTNGKAAVSTANVPLIAVAVITNVMENNISIKDAKDLAKNLLQLWNESNVWYEFFEQLVYILFAVTVPSFSQGAMGKIKEKISSSK